VPLVAAAEILTAAKRNLIAGTDVPVFTNSTTRDAAFGGAGEKVLAEGQLCYLSDSNIVQYYSGAAWATVGPASASALTLISTTTIGTTVASVTVSSAFSATYDNYKVILSGGTGSVDDTAITLILGATTTGYYMAYTGANYTGASSSIVSNDNAANWSRIGCIRTNGLSATFELIAPNLAKLSQVSGTHMFASAARAFGGFLNDTTQYTAFTLTAASGTLTGGTIRVYGYQNS